LTEIVCTRTNGELRAAKNAFMQRNKASVESWVTGDTSGKYQQFLLRCLQGDREEGTIDSLNAEKQAVILNKIFTGELDRDDILMNTLARASCSSLKVISDAFEKITSVSLIDKLKEKYGGDIEKAILARLTPKHIYYAQQLGQLCII